MNTTQKKTSFSELSCLLQGSNHTHLKHSRQSSLKTTKSLYTVPELKTEGTSPTSSEPKQKGNRFHLTSSSHQLLNTIRNKKQSQAQCLVLTDQKDRRVSALSRVSSGEPLRKTFSNPINRYEYQKTFAVRPKSSSARCIPTVNTNSNSSSSSRTNSPLEPVPAVITDLTAEETFKKPINENYTLENKFETDKSIESMNNPSRISSNQSPFTKGTAVELANSISRRDSLTLKQFNSDLTNNTPSINYTSRTQLKLDHLRDKSAETRNSIHATDDIIYLLNHSADSSVSNNSLSPQKDVWKITAQGKFWLNSDLSTNLMYQQLNLQCKMVERFNYNCKSILVSRMSNIIKKREKKPARIKSNGKNSTFQQRRELSPDSTSSLTLENFVSLDALTHFDDFPAVKDGELKSILVRGKKSCEEIWHHTERKEFIAYESPTRDLTNGNFLSASTPSDKSFDKQYRNT